jgi:hypothetical protein
MPRLDAREVAAVFSAPFHNFLRETDEVPAAAVAPPAAGGVEGARVVMPAGKWYEGSWSTWHDSQWRMHFFYVPVTNQKVVKPRIREGGLAALSENEAENAGEDGGDPGRYKVWGMTARIIVDAATVAYGEKPEFEHNRHFGDEKIIDMLAQMGRMGEKKRSGSVLGAEDLKKAREAVREAEKKEAASKM